MKVLYVGFDQASGLPGAKYVVWDNGGTRYGPITASLPIAQTDVTNDQIKTAIINAIIPDVLANVGLTVVASDFYFMEQSMNNRSTSYPSLAVNTSRQPSTAQDAFISAAVDITATLSLITGQTGKVTLQYADNSAFNTNVVTVNNAQNGNTGTLTIGLGLTQTATATVCGVVPASKYYRLVTTNVTGTPTYGTPTIQEILL